MITKEIIVENILSYLQLHITLQDMVHLSEEAIMNNDFEDDTMHTFRSMPVRIGSADVKSFGLSWEDCEEMMHQLGF